MSSDIARMVTAFALFVIANAVMPEGPRWRRLCAGCLFILGANIYWLGR